MCAENFSRRPTSASAPSISRIAPDGTLYVVDMYRGIIQHKGYMTEYLRDYVLTHKLEQPNSFGRIYRIVHETTQPRYDAAADARDAGAAGRSCCRIRMDGGATWRSSCSSSAGQVGCAGAAKNRGERDGRARPSARAVDARRARRDRARRRDAGVVTCRPATCACRRCGSPNDGCALPNHPMHGAVLKLLDDKDWAVRRQLAATLGELPAGIEGSGDRQRARAATATIRLPSTRR